MANEKPKERALALRADFATVYVSAYGGELMKPVRAQFKLSEKRGIITLFRKRPLYHPPDTSS